MLSYFVVPRRSRLLALANIYAYHRASAFAEPFSHVWDRLKVATARPVGAMARFSLGRTADRFPTCPSYVGHTALQIAWTCMVTNEAPYSQHTYRALAGLDTLR